MALVWSPSTLVASSAWDIGTYGGGLFLAAQSATSNVYQTSPDGINWTSRSWPSSQFWFAHAHNGSVFVALALSTPASAPVFAISSDGINWAQSTMAAVAGTTAFWQRVAWNGSVFCAVGRNNLNASICATSPDGITWTTRATPSLVGSGNYWNRIASNGSEFLITSVNNSNASAATSPDGITWTTRTWPANVGVAQIAWNGLTYYGISGAGNAYACTSPDGIVWTERTAPDFGIHNVGVCGDKFVVTTNGTADSYSSTDGINWEHATLPAAGTWRGILGNTSSTVAVALPNAAAVGAYAPVASPPTSFWTSLTGSREVI